MTLDDYKWLNTETGEMNPIIGCGIYACISKSRDKLIPAYGGYTYQLRGPETKLPLMRKDEHLWTVRAFLAMDGNLYWGMWQGAEVLDAGGE